MNSYKKRERTQNWAQEEKRFLLDLCRKDMRIIENKRLDAGLTAVKNKAWRIIHQRFCATFGTDRTCNRLKEQWRRMKACTRNDIIDYHTRVSRYGQEIADRKRPTAFTFEVWDFILEAKRACKNEALDGVDYSKVPLTLETELDAEKNSIIIPEKDENQKIVIKQEEQNDLKQEDEDDDDDDHSTERLSNSPNELSSYENSEIHSQFPFKNNGTNIETEQSVPPFNITNFAATLETLNALRTQFITHTAQQDNVEEVPRKRIRTEFFPGNSSELMLFMEMQSKEHAMRMQILNLQLQASQFNRDAAEIHKTLAVQKLHDLAKRYNKLKK